MHIISERLGKLKSFFLILILLYILNVIFNLKFAWGGVAVIVRVYIFVLSFYLVFIFAQVNIEKLKLDYKDKYGSKGFLLLFILVRIIPFFLIYLMTSVFTFTNYLTFDNWPAVPFFRLMDGKFSNTLFYCLILLFIIKQNRRPKIAIPQFILYSVMFFTLDKTLYVVLQNGYGVGLIKFAKYIVFSFFLVHEFSTKGRGLFKPILASFLSGIIFFYLVIAVNLLIFNISDVKGYAHNASAALLLKSGFSQPMDEISSLIINMKEKGDLSDLIYYSGIYKKKIEMPVTIWNKLLSNSNFSDAESIIKYMKENKIHISFENLNIHIKKFSQMKDKKFLDMKELQRYYSSYTLKYWEKFKYIYDNGSIDLKKWLLKSLEYNRNKKNSYFLLEKLTDKEKEISRIAYSALVRITRSDPADDLKLEINDLKVVFFFREKIMKAYRRPR